MRTVLRTPGVRSLFVTACVGRLPMGALGLLLVLHTHDLTGSYAGGGLAAGTYALALGLSNPILARVVDRRGQTAVVRVGAVVAATAIATLALLPAGAPLAVIAATAALAGAAQPPIGACMRALWPELLPGEDDRHAAYALESVVLEVVYICGPVVIVAGIGALSAAAAILACGAFVLVGDLAFAQQEPSRAWRPHAAVRRDLTGALRGQGVRVLIAVFALLGLAIGAVEVVVPAALDAVGQRGLTGALLGLWGVGSMLAGIVAACAGAPADPARRLTVLLACWGAAHAAIALAAGPAALGLALLVAGATIAPTLVCANAMLDHLAPAGTLTEAFTWTTAGLTAGIALGSTLAGAIVEAASPAAAMAALGGGGLLAAGLARAAASGPLSAPAPAPVH